MRVGLAKDGGLARIVARRIFQAATLPIYPLDGYIRLWYMLVP
jgi:hypothetical protein